MGSTSRLNEFQNAIGDIDQTSFTTETDRKDALAAARSLCNRLERPMETMLRIAWIDPSYVACLKIALDIGLFQALSEGAEGSKCTVTELANATKTNSDLLVRVLRMLASMGTIREVDAGVFAATELSKSLTKRPVNACIDYRYSLSNPLFQQVPNFLKSNGYQQPSNLLDSPWQPAFDTKMSCFEWIGQNAEALEMFTNHMAGYTSQRGSWEQVYPVRDRIFGEEEDVHQSQDVILADVGGGSGHDLKRFASQFLPDLQEPRLVLQDLPEVIEQAKKSDILPAAIKAVPIDFTKESPVPGARAYYMHSVLHDWPDNEVHNILSRMHSTLSQPTKTGLKPKLLLNEIVIPKKGVQPQPAALDMIMMAAFASHERSEEQWTALLEAAGYKIVKIFSKVDVDEAVIEAEAIA